MINHAHRNHISVGPAGILLIQPWLSNTKLTCVKIQIIPRGSHLKEREKGVIEVFNRCAKRVREIVRETGRSYNVAGTFLYKKGEYGKCKRSGRASLLSQRENEQL